MREEMRACVLTLSLTLSMCVIFIPDKFLILKILIRKYSRATVWRLCGFVIIWLSQPSHELFGPGSSNRGWLCAGVW